MYLGDPREQQICPDEHTIWEENNRVEKRYQWGAMVLDLCDLSPEEYATTIFHVSGNTGGGGDEKTSNDIVVNFSEDNISITMAYPPTSDLYVVIKDSDGGKQVVKINKNEESHTEAISGINAEKISDLLIGFSEESATTNTCSDDTYKYIVKKGSTPVPPQESKCKYGYFKHIEPITEETILEKTSDVSVFNKICEFEYDIEAVSIPGFNDVSDDEYNEIMRQQELDLYIFTTEKVNEIFINDSEEQTSIWDKNYTIYMINGEKYYATRFVQPGLVNIYDPNYEEPSKMIFNYKITTE